LQTPRRGPQTNIEWYRNRRTPALSSGSGIGSLERLRRDRQRLANAKLRQEDGFWEHYLNKMLSAQELRRRVETVRAATASPQVAPKEVQMQLQVGIPTLL